MRRRCHPRHRRPQSHAHIQLTVRPLNENGTWQYKTEKEYLCVRTAKNGASLPLSSRLHRPRAGRSSIPTKSAKRKCTWLLPQPRRMAMFVRTNTPKAPGTAGRIPSLRGGTAKNNCSSARGVGHGSEPLSGVGWSRQPHRPPQPWPSVDWRNGPRFTRAWQPRRWSGAASSPIAAN